MSKIIIKNNSGGHSVAEYKINWIHELTPTLRKRYNKEQTNTILKNICSSHVFIPALRDEEILKIEEENNGDKVFYQLTKNGWVYRGTVTEFLIKEEELTFIDDIVNTELAKKIKEKIIEVQNTALDFINYEEFYLLDENGETLDADEDFYQSARNVVKEAFSDEYAEYITKEVIARLFNAKIEEGTFVVLFNKKRLAIVANMKNVFHYQNYENLKKYIMETDPAIDADVFCRKVVEECIEFPKTGRTLYKKIGNLVFEKLWGEERWHLTHESEEILDEVCKIEYGVRPYPNRCLKCLPGVTFLASYSTYTKKNQTKYYLTSLMYKYRTLFSYTCKPAKYKIDPNFNWNVIIKDFYD